MKTKHTFLLAAAAVLLFGARSFAVEAAVNSSDKSFLTNAYEDGLAEIQAGEMGVRKTGNADLKAFAEHMVKDHSEANAKLKSLADTKNVEVPSSPSLMAQGKGKLLDHKTGADFDKAFAEAMVNDHKKAVESFEKAANEATDQDVKNFAAQTLPTLKTHLSMAEELQNKVGK